MRLFTVSKRDRLEQVPLLTEESACTSAKIPWGQLAILCYARSVESWLFFTIFPYLAQMVEDTGVEHDKIGFYAGLIESIFSVTQFLCMQFIWRKASDVFARKPVLAISLAGISVSALAFGLSRTIWQIVVFRAMGGCFSGSLVVLRVMFSEISTPETRARIFSFFALKASLAASLGPLAGGYLARPAERFELFRHWGIFVTYPYLLPSMLAAFLSGSAAVLSIVFLKETKHFTPEDLKTVPSTVGLLHSPGVGTVMAINTWASFMGFAWISVAPVFWYTRVSLGGLGLSPRGILLIMAISGTLQTGLSLCLSPILQKRFGTFKILWIASISFLANFAIQPILHAVKRNGEGPLLLAIMAADLWLPYGQNLAFFGLNLAIVEVSPSPQALGSLMGLFLSNGIMMRAITPTIATSAYAFGVHKQILGGQFAWFVLCASAVGLCMYMPNFAKVAKQEKLQTARDPDVCEE